MPRIATKNAAEVTTEATRRKAQFIRQLAEFLVGNQAGKSICLQMDQMRPENGVPRLATEWAALRAKTPLFGYPSIEEAEKTLTDFLR